MKNVSIQFVRSNAKRRIIWLTTITNVVHASSRVKEKVKCTAEKVDKAVPAYDRLLQIKLENQNKLDKELDHKIRASAKL